MGAKYSDFSLCGFTDNYRLSLGAYNGSSTAGDTMTNNAFDGSVSSNGMAFSTYDRDNDNARDYNCAAFLHGGWWYNHCSLANLNGRWASRDYQGLKWYDSGHMNLRPTYSEMKVRMET